MTFTVRTRGVPGPILQDFECPDHGLFESLQPRDTESVPCPVCSAPSAWRISAPLARVKLVETNRGKSDQPTGMALSTRELGEGMPLEEWRAKRERMWREHDHKQNKEILRGY